jgi:chemotaxis protein CheD
MTSLNIHKPFTGETIDVEMGEISVSSCLTDVLVGYGLGACIGVCVYDYVAKIAGLAHIVLPQRQSHSLSSVNKVAMAPGKFADLAIPNLIDEMSRYGAETANLRAAVAGGAHIFSGGSIPGSAISRLEIGQRNVTAVMDGLARYGIPILAMDVGGCHGRTLSIRVNDGMMTVRPIGGDEKVLAILSRGIETVAAA